MNVMYLIVCVEGMPVPRSYVCMCSPIVQLQSLQCVYQLQYYITYNIDTSNQAFNAASPGIDGIKWHQKWNYLWNKQMYGHVLKLVLLVLNV